MMGHVRKAIMKLTSVIIVIAVTFITVSCSSQKNGTAYSVYFLNEDGTSLTEGRVYIESQDAVHLQLKQRPDFRCILCLQLVMFRLH